MTAFATLFSVGMAPLNDRLVEGAQLFGSLHRPLSGPTQTALSNCVMEALTEPVKFAEMSL